MTLRRLALILFALLAWPAGAAAQCTTTVSAVANIQAALNAAVGGDTICLNVGNYDIATNTSLTFPAHSGSSTVTVTTTGGCPVRRITSTDNATLARLRSTTNGYPPILITGSNWTLECLGVTQTGGNTFGLVRIGSDTETNIANKISGITIDRMHCYVADAADGTAPARALASERRCWYVGLAQDLTVKRSYCENFKDDDGDSQCFAAVNAVCDPCLVEDNYMEAATENFIFGGSDPAVVDLVPTNITVRLNHFFKRLSWMGDGWTYKNLGELKNATYVTIEDNTFENNWAGEGGTGEAIWLTVRNQSGSCPGCSVFQVAFNRNILKNVSSGVTISGHDDGDGHPWTAVDAHHFTLTHNRIEINVPDMGGDGTGFEITHSPEDVVIDNNTITGAVKSLYISTEVGTDPPSFVYTDNLVNHGAYFIIGDQGTGTVSLAASFSGYTVSGNTVAGMELTAYDSSYYPSGQTFITQTAFEALFRDYAGGDLCQTAYAGVGAECEEEATTTRVRFRRLRTTS